MVPQLTSEGPTWQKVRSSEAGGKWATLLFTEEGLDRIRERVQKNAEDIEANRESWLADLFD